MPQIIKRYFWIALFVAGLQTSWGFALLGPLPPDAGGEPWQVFAIGYAEGGVSYFGSIPGAPFWFQDIGGPHNLGEEYRRNTRVLYYTYDASFLAGEYFGEEALTNIDGAFAILNNLTNVDKYSPGLTEFPQSVQEYNFTAQSLNLTDLKSMTLHLLTKQLGLADAARYTWTLHDRINEPPLPCPIGEVYMVVQRNFDIVPSALNQVQYSAYVNGALISYYISEVCGGSSLLASTVPYLTDPAGQLYGPVAANTFLGDWNFNEFETTELLHIPTIYGLQIGGYYTGLTRDDVAGLRYLLSTNNINREPIPATSLLFTVSTNLNLQQLLPNGNGTNGTGDGGFYFFDGTVGYGNYGWLVAESLTNSPAVLLALYPGLVIASSSNYFVLATNYTFTQYFTNLGVGTTFPPPLVLVTVTNKSYFLLEKYVTKFANVFPDHVSPNTIVQQQTTTVTPNVGAPFGSPPVTNTTTQTITLAGVPSGDFFLLGLFHTNVCPLDFLYTGLTNVAATTNFLSSTSTNVVTPTNSSSFSATLIQITYFTNYQFVTHPVTCAEVAGAPNLYQGIGRISFVRADFDSLIGQFFQPITNYYTMVALTNSQLQVQHLVRVVTQPDINLAAADLNAGPGAIPVTPTVIRNITYNSTQIIPGLHGPGLIDTPTTFVYNKVGPTFFNGPFADANSFLNPTEVNETTQIPGLQWASYDGSTNDPIVYPNGTSIQNLEGQIVIQLSATPSGSLVGNTLVNVNNVQFSASGGAFTPPYTWSAFGIPGVIGSGLPFGLMVSPSGRLSGAANTSGTFDFILQLTDSLGRTVQWTLSINI